MPCLKSQPGQFKLFSFFLPKSLVRVRPVSRKCVGRSDQSATCLCALYLSECSILVCVCLCLSVYVVIVCMNAKFMCVLCSFACLIQCICLHRVFSLVSSLCPLLAQMLSFSSVICVFFCNPLLFRMCRPISHFFSWPQRYDEPLLIEQKLPVSMPAYAQDVKLSTLSFLKKCLTLSCVFCH